MIDSTSATPQTSVPGTAGPAAGEAPALSLLDQVQALARELQGLVSDRVELLSLELQRAARSLLQVVALIVAIAILGVTVWLALWAAAIHLLMQAGLPMLGALLLTIGVNGLVIVVALVRVRSVLPRVALPATRRHLMAAPDPIPAPQRQERRPDERSTAPV